ncbi:hypothetical protein D8B26_004963 [Coccidioides posadasii str. Silveira]|uniref:uncharacterized protein n=1 Tax=Coccidioides posadasii (strain RMSCC 757 / Silveira) TaxID=443226 RepID=UPI001BF1567D|nr:hypothetical protein D8B26_004963 [Coccidioides posadasii str. Silveira]
MLRSSLLTLVKTYKAIAAAVDPGPKSLYKVRRSLVTFHSACLAMVVSDGRLQHLLVSLSHIFCMRSGCWPLASSKKRTPSKIRNLSPGILAFHCIQGNVLDRLPP